LDPVSYEHVLRTLGDRILPKKKKKLKVLRRRRVFRLSLGSGRRGLCRCRTVEEECVISTDDMWNPFPSHAPISFFSFRRHLGTTTIDTRVLQLVAFLSPALTPASPSEPSGGWDSIHVFETVERGRQAHYKLTSTVMLQLITRRGSVDNSSDAKVAWKHDGEVSLSGSMTRQVCVYQCV
jgi:hypothetical protein